MDKIEHFGTRSIVSKCKKLKNENNKLINLTLTLMQSI